jgi:hypothetical protein
MVDRSLTARLLSPAGLILAGVGLLLPFGAVSCTPAPGTGAALTYTGSELIGNTGGTLSTTPQFAEAIGPAGAAGPHSGTSLLNEADTTGLRTLLVAVAGLILIGVISTVLQPRLTRVTVVAAMAYAAMVTLIGAQLAGRHTVAGWFATHPEIFGKDEAGKALPDGFAIRPGVGFWLSLVLLIAVGTGNLLAILGQTRRHHHDGIDGASSQAGVTSGRRGQQPGATAV